MNRSRKRKRGHKPTGRLTPEQAVTVAKVRRLPAPKPRPRLRSSYVILGSVGTLFAGLCVYGVVRDRFDRTCVDADNRVISDQDCERGVRGARWYYGGTNQGGKMINGSYERGGFGGRTSGGS